MRSPRGIGLALLLAAVVASAGPARGDGKTTVVAVIPLATGDQLAIYGKPVADAIADRLKRVAGVEVESLSLSGALPARVSLVIDGRIVDAGSDRVGLEARVRDPGRGIAIGEVATEPRPLAQIDVAAAELADLLAPKLVEAIAERRRLAAAEARREPGAAPARPAHGADPSEAAPIAPVDPRPAMVVVDATGSADGVPASGIVTRAGYWLAERLGFRPVPSAAKIKEAFAAGAGGAHYALLLHLRGVSFTWHGSVLSAHGRVRVVLIDDRGGVIFDRTVRTGTVVGNRGDRQDALVHYVAIQAVDIVVPHLKRALAR